MHRGTRWGAAGVAALAFALVAAACSSDGGSSDGEAASPGAAVYRANCASCHGADGGGGQGPAIGDGEAAAKYDRAEMVDIVANGRDGMPSFDRLSEEQLDQVVDYVRDELGQDDASTTTTEPDGDGEASGERGSLSGLPPEVADAADDDWPLPNRDYDSSRAVTDAAIASETVDDLELAWTYEVPGAGQFGNLTTTPIVSGDSVYVGALTTEVHAIDRESGEQRFAVGDQAAIFGPTGVGLGWGRLYGTKGDAEGRGSLLVAYDAETGEELWETDLGANGSDINIQPLAYDGLVFASTGGYGGGAKGTIYAVDAETGEVVWDFVVIEDPEVWGNPELNSGGGVWYPPAIDTEAGVAYFGTGNPYPFPGAKGYPNGSSRPGDNRWTDSTVALDIDSGELVWGHQAIAHDLFDRDAMLAARATVEIDGEDRDLTISSGKLGIVFGLDAETGERLWETPVGKHENDELTAIDGPTLVYPGSLGGVQTPMAIADGTIYASVENAPSLYEGPEETSYGFSVQLGTDDAQFVAIDAATGEVKWDVPLEGDAFGGATVSGDLVFTSTFGGEVLALDRETGETVWSYDAGGGINGWPAVAGDELYIPVGMADPPRLLKLELPS